MQDNGISLITKNLSASLSLPYANPKSWYFGKEAFGLVISMLVLEVHTLLCMIPVVKLNSILFPV